AGSSWPGRTMSSTRCAAIGGWPSSRCCLCRRHLPLAASRCHRIIVSGETRKGSPTLPSEHTAQPGKDRPICWSITYVPVELVFENTNLVPEHPDLDVLVRLGPTR